VEQHAQRLLGLLPVYSTLERTRDAIQIDLGGSEGVVLLVTGEALELRLPTIEWTRGAYGPAEASVLWKRVKNLEKLDDAQILDLVEAARAARLRQFIKCRFCGCPTPPEYRTHKDVCHRCAEENLGVVF